MASEANPSTGDSNKKAGNRLSSRREGRQRAESPVLPDPESEDDPESEPEPLPKHRHLNRNISM